MDPTGVALAFADATLEPDPTWTRIDDPTPGGIRGVASWEIDRGRSSELDKTSTGTARAQINDTTGTFDPTNASSPLYGYLDPMKQAAVCLYNPVADTWHPRFRGFASDWLYDMDVSGRLNVVTLEMADAFDLFAGLEMTPGNVGTTPPVGSKSDIYFAEDVALDACQTRINQALDDAGFPAGLRDEIFTGNVGLQGLIYARRDALLSVLLDTADAEFPGVSNLFMSAAGGLVFHGRFARFNPDNPTYNITRWRAGSGLVASADPDVAPISGLAFRRSKDDIINAALVLPQNVDEQDVPGALVTDAVSIDTYGWRGVSFENLATRNGNGPTTAVEETRKFAEYYVENYASPRTRVTQLRFRPRHPDRPNAPALWALLCGVEISDIIELETQHLGGGGFTEDFFVEGVHYTCLPAQADPATGEQLVPDLELVLDVSPTAYFTSNPFT